VTIILNEQPASLQVVNDNTAIVQINGGAFGPQGIQGNTGPQGVAGGSVISGSGIPSNEIGNNGDVYIDVSTGYFYGPKAETWPVSPFFYNYNQRVEYLQSLPSDTWNITHSLSGKPSVTIVDSAGTIIIGDVQYLSNTQIQVSFTAPFSGSAYLT
jgi:hypothetical protein